MAVQINSGNTNFRVGTEGPGECGPWEYNGRLFVVGYDRSTSEIQVWYSEDAGASWSEADAGNRPVGSTQEYALGCTGCAIGSTLYIVYPFADPVLDAVAAALCPFDMSSLLWGTPVATQGGSPHLEPNFNCYDSNSGIVALPGERLRLLHLNDSPSFSYGVRFSDFDLSSRAWGAQTEVNATDNNRTYPYGIVAGASGRTHAFYHDDSLGAGGQIGYQRTIGEDGALAAEQPLVAAGMNGVSRFGFGQPHSLYLPSVGAVRIAAVYPSEIITSPSDHARVRIAIADSADEPVWSQLELFSDPVYDGVGAGQIADGNIMACCFFGHLGGLQVAFCGEALADLPRTADSEVDLWRARYLGTAGPGELALDPGATPLSGVHLRPVTGGVGALCSVDYAQVWFQKIALDFCTG